MKRPLTYSGAVLRKWMLAVVLCAAALPAAAEVVVVVAAHSPIGSVTDSEIADIFLGKLKVLSDGTPVAPLDQLEGSSEREAFYQKFTGKSPSQLKAYWSKVIFTGRGRPPRALPGDAAVIQALQRDPNAIAYLERGSLDTSVRVLR